jgi:hypothetical protein
MAAQKARPPNYSDVEFWDSRCKRVEVCVCVCVCVCVYARAMPLLKRATHTLACICA